MSSDGSSLDIYVFGDEDTNGQLLISSEGWNCGLPIRLLAGRTWLDKVQIPRADVPYVINLVDKKGRSLVRTSVSPIQSMLDTRLVKPWITIDPDKLD